MGKGIGKSGRVFMIKRPVRSLLLLFFWGGGLENERMCVCVVVGRGKGRGREIFFLKILFIYLRE